MPLRPLTEMDLAMVRHWRNSPDVRKQMFTSHEISEAEHLAWFKRVENDASAHWYVHLDRDGQADGVLYLTQHNKAAASAELGFYMSPSALPGAGTLLGVEGLDIAFSSLKLHKLGASALGSNERGIRFYHKLGFSQEGCLRDAHFDGATHVDIIKFGLLSHEWPAKREELLAGLARRQEKT